MATITAGEYFENEAKRTGADRARVAIAPKWYRLIKRVPRTLTGAELARIRANGHAIK